MRIAPDVIRQEQPASVGAHMGKVVVVVPRRTSRKHSNVPFERNGVCKSQMIHNESAALMMRAMSFVKEAVT